MVYIALIHADNKYYIMTNREGTITAFETARKGLDFFENGYNMAHARGKEGSASACINNIFFRPSIVAMMDVDDIRNRLISNDGPHLVCLSNIAGVMNGLTTDTVKAKTEWENGVTPRLI